MSWKAKKIGFSIICLMCILLFASYSFAIDLNLTDENQSSSTNTSTTNNTTDTNSTNDSSNTSSSTNTSSENTTNTTNTTNPTNKVTNPKDSTTVTNLPESNLGLANILNILLIVIGILLILLAIAILIKLKK